MKTHILSLDRYKSIHYILGVVLLWGLSDAIVSFYLPIQVESFVNNLVLFGVLLSFPAVIGMFADPIIGFLSNRTHYFSFLFCGLLLSSLLVTAAVLPFSIILILWLMAIWGLCYELIGVAIFHYVSRYHEERAQSRYFGVIYLVMNAAFMIGPVLGGYIVLNGTRMLYGVCLVFLLAAILIAPQLRIIHRHRERTIIAYDRGARYSLKKQLLGFKKVWRYAAIFFVAVFLYNVWDSFVWDLVPLQSIGGSAIAAGLITGVFTLPKAVFSGYGGSVADKFGRNVTFLLGLGLASVFTIIFGLQSGIVGQIVTALVASLGFAFAEPAMMGETSQQGQTHPSELGNVTAVQRLFVNAGFVLGPIFGGIFAKSFGIHRAFTVLGVIMLVCALCIAGRMIHFHVRGRIHRSLEAEFDL